jgi:alpha-glucosidase
MKAQDTLRAIRWMGWRTALEAIRYALVRDRLDRRLLDQPAGPDQPVGPLVGHRVADAVDEFDFETASLKIRFLREDSVHICWEPGMPPPPYGLAVHGIRPVPVERRPIESGWRLRSHGLTLDVDSEGAITIRSAAGQVIRQDRPPSRSGERWTVHSPLPADAVISGLGERAAPLNLRPGSYRFWNTDPAGSYQPGFDPLYVTIPWYIALQRAGSYSIFYENPHDGRLTLGDDAEISFAAGQLRYVLVAGPPAQAIARLQTMIGHPAMPPRWALGYHQSRWGYSDERDIRAVIDGFDRHGLPLAALHLDIDYMRGFRVFTVDRERFPDLPGLAAELKDRLGGRLVAILNPGVKIDRQYDLHRQGVHGRHFCSLPNGELLRGPVWPGLVHFPDFTDPSTRAWWGQHYRSLLDQGIDGIWHDMNEPTTFAAWGDGALPLSTRHDLEGAGGDHRTAHNVYAAAMNQGAFEAMRAARPDRRPWLLSRSGWAGSTRHAWNWTGDTASTWAMLRTTIATVLNLGLSGIPFTGPDIGGFSGAPSAELYVRWFELATFLPFFRTHSSKTSPAREPWSFGPDALAITRKFLDLRTAFMPYLYTLAADSHQTGQPMVRPVYWTEPAASELWQVDDCFLLGDHLLVAPVLEPGCEERSLRLPSGSWYSFGTDDVHVGAARVIVPGALDQVPTFVRAGAVLPLAEGDGLALHLYPPDGDIVHSSLYADAGDGYGPSRWDAFHVTGDGRRAEIEWTADGDYPFPWDRVAIVVHGRPTGSAVIDGKTRSIDGDRIWTGPFNHAELQLGE